MRTFFVFRDPLNHHPFFFSPTSSALNGPSSRESGDVHHAFGLPEMTVFVNHSDGTGIKQTIGHNRRRR